MSIPQHHSNEIHAWAAAGGAIAGALPVGLDTGALVTEEVATAKINILLTIKT